MRRNTPTFGDFWDEVAKTHTLEGEVWLDQWREETGLKNRDIWLEYRQLFLDEQLVFNFTQDILCLFRERLRNIGTNELYQSTSENGRAFLCDIQAVGLTFGIDLSPVINTSVTLIEFLAQSKQH